MLVGPPASMNMWAPETKGKVEGAWRRGPEQWESSLTRGCRGAGWTSCCGRMGTGQTTGPKIGRRVGTQGASGVRELYQLIEGGLYFRSHGERRFKVLVN